MSSTTQSLDSFCHPCRNFVPVDVSTPKPLPFPTAGRLVTVRRIGGLLLAAIVCLLTGKAPLQTFQEDPLDKVVTQDDDHVNEKRTAMTGREEERRDEIEAPPPREEVRRQEAPPAPAHNALLDTTQKWDRRKLFRESFRESDGIYGKPAPLPAGIAEFPRGLRCISEIDPRRPGVQAEPPKIISQEDLTELEILGKRAREAKRRYATKAERIRRAIESGARVEAGLRSVKATVLVVR